MQVNDDMTAGFMSLGVKPRGVRGYKFGLQFSAEDEQAGIAFLKTL